MGAARSILLQHERHSFSPSIHSGDFSHVRPGGFQRLKGLQAQDADLPSKGKRVEAWRHERGVAASSKQNSFANERRRKTSIIWLQMVCAPLALLVFVGLSRRCFQSVMERQMDYRRAVEPVLASLPQPSPPVRVPLALRRLEAFEVGSTTGQAAAVLSEAETMARRARLAYAAAGLAWIATTTLAYALGSMDLRDTGFSAPVRLQLYLLQGTALFLLVWFVAPSLQTRRVILGGYMVFGLLAAAIGPSVSASAFMVSCFLSVVVPLTGLLLLLARPLRP
jgi:hypothetical protein